MRDESDIAGAISCLPSSNGFEISVADPGPMIAGVKMAIADIWRPRAI
jgi:hypothetical protein